MMLKPKTSVGEVKAQLYKRYQQLDKSNSLAVVYRTVYNGAYTYWLFDYTLALEVKTKNGLDYSQAFIKIDEPVISNFDNTIDIVSDTTVLGYLNATPKQTVYFQFSSTARAWLKISATPLTFDISRYANIARYQTNRYYYVCSFDFMFRGDVSGSTTQPIKGNVMPITTLSIRFFDDNVNLQQDDLVVVEGRLYSVENPIREIKYSPKKYTTYYATLNSIL